MLLTEWNWDDTSQVRWEKGRHEAARNALKEGLSIEQTVRITGVPVDRMVERWCATRIMVPSMSCSRRALRM